MAIVGSRGATTTRDKTGNTVITNGKSTSSAYSSNGGGTAKANYTPIKTTSQINREDNAKIIKNEYNPNYSNNSATYSQLMNAKANYEKSKDLGDGGNYGGGNNAKEEVAEENNWLDSYYSAWGNKYDELINSLKKSANLDYENSLSNLNAGYRKIMRQLLKNYSQKGYDAPVSNVENLWSANAEARNELARNKASTDASNASVAYNGWNTLANSIANSNASDAQKKKFFSYA